MDPLRLLEAFNLFSGRIWTTERSCVLSIAVKPYRLLGEPLLHFWFVPPHSTPPCDDDICYLFVMKTNLNTKIADFAKLQCFFFGWWEASISWIECRIYLLRFVPFFLWFFFIIYFACSGIFLRTIFKLISWSLKQSYSEELVCVFFCFLSDGSWMTL